jgi:UDPglucose--hexose-1-phosphate uridylyltransferase
VPEIRIDPLSGRRTIVAGERSRRPGGEPSCEPAAPIDVRSDPFAEGHEDRTPPELYALRPGGGPANSPGWSVRVVANLYPALQPAGLDGCRPGRAPSGEAPGGEAPGGETPGGGPYGGDRGDDGGDAEGWARSSRSPADSELLIALPARGAHEVIVNGPQSVLSLADLPREQVALAVDVWRARMRAHEDAAYVQLIVNERREGGASLPHTHAQLYALDFVPADVARERERAGAYTTRTMGHDLVEDLLAEEVRRSERIVAIDEEAVLLAPYASRVPFQLMLVPRRPCPRFETDTVGAALLHDGLSRLARLLGCSPPLNLWVRTAPRGVERFCWRIDIAPRLTHLAGLELSTGLNLNILAPEHAAALLREA